MHEHTCAYEWWVYLLDVRTIIRSFNGCNWHIREVARCFGCNIAWPQTSSVIGGQGALVLTTDSRAGSSHADNKMKTKETCLISVPAAVRKAHGCQMCQNYEQGCRLEQWWPDRLYQLYCLLYRLWGDGASPWVWLSCSAILSTFHATLLKISSFPPTHTHSQCPRLWQ